MQWHSLPENRHVQRSWTLTGRLCRREELGHGHGSAERGEGIPVGSDPAVWEAWVEPQVLSPSRG